MLPNQSKLPTSPQDHSISHNSACNKNLAIANRSRITCAHNMSKAFYNDTVTLKYRLMVTQGHWKRNHWVDHTQLTISRVIGRWILSWPWNMGQRSLKVIEISAIRKLGCGFLFAFYSNCGRIWYSVLKNDVTLKTKLGVVQSHWKWCCSIDHMRLSIGQPL